MSASGKGTGQQRPTGFMLLPILMVLAGCGVKQSSLLIERHSRGPLPDITMIGHRANWHLVPETQTQEQRKVEISVTFASHEYLQKFFNDRRFFGRFAGPNPYFLENLVFYVKINNKSDDRIQLNPTEFILIDNRGNQYTPINEDYVTAIAESRTPVATATRGVLEDAHPGYFGLSLPVGKIVNMKPQGRFALIKQSSLQNGLLYPGVTYDGLVVFWSPSLDATTLRLLVTNVKTDFDAHDFAQTSLEFPFTFSASNPLQQLRPVSPPQELSQTPEPPGPSAQASGRP